MLSFNNFGFENAYWYHLNRLEYFDKKLILFCYVLELRDRLTEYEKNHNICRYNPYIKVTRCLCTCLSKTIDLANR